MVAAAFVAPYLLDATTRFAEAAARLPAVELGLVTTEPADRLPGELRRSLAAHWRVGDALDAGRSSSPRSRCGRPAHRLPRCAAMPMTSTCIARGRSSWCTAASRRLSDGVVVVRHQELSKTIEMADRFAADLQLFAG